MMTLNTANTVEIRNQIVSILEQYKELAFIFHCNAEDLKPWEDPCYFMTVEQVINSQVEFCEKVYDFVHYHWMRADVSEEDLSTLEERLNLLAYLEERALCEEEERA